MFCILEVGAGQVHHEQLSAEEERVLAVASADSEKLVPTVLQNKRLAKYNINWNSFLLE